MITPLGQLLRSARSYRSPYSSLKDMADYCGMRVSRLSAIENGRAEPTTDELQLMAAHLVGMGHTEFFARRDRDIKAAKSFSELLEKSQEASE